MTGRKLSELPDFEGKALAVEVMARGQVIATSMTSAVDLMVLGLIQVVAKLQDRVAIAAPEDEPVAEVDIWVELGRDLSELKQFAGFRDLPIGNHELYIHPAPEKPTYEQGYVQGFKAGMREKP